jgi:hypothetical protein
MPTHTAAAAARTLPLTPEALRDALQNASFREMGALYDALIHVHQAYEGFLNQPRAAGLIAGLIEDEIGRICELSDEVWQSAEGRLAKNEHEAEDRGRILLTRQLHAGIDWAAVVGQGLEALCAVTRGRLTVNAEGRR